MEASICEACGSAVEAHMWPFCPHTRMESAAHGVIGDEIVGGMWQENFGNTPEYFDSTKRMLARADELNLRLRDQWAGPGDRYLSNWAAVSPKTLADAKVLLERVGQASHARRATLDTAQFSITEWHES